MTPHGWLTLVACAGQLGLALLAVLRGGKSPLALPLALLCMALFSWNLAALAFDISGTIQWRWIDVATSPLSAPLALHFVVVFVGRRRELRWPLAAAYAAFVPLCAVGLLAFVWEPAARFLRSPNWALTFFGGVVPTISYALWLLVKYLRATSDPQEAVRVRLVLAALAIGAVLGSTELLADLGLGTPRGGNLGALGTAAVLSVVAFRFRLLENDLSSLALAYALAFGALAVIAYLGVFYFLATSTAMLVFGTVTITLALLASLRQLGAAVTRRRHQVERLTSLGRFAAQMAHDLKNPLAALKGAVQYLQEERARGRTLENEGEFLELLSEQIERIRGVVERYQRLGRVEAALAPLQLNELAQSVVTSQAFAAGAQVTLRTELDPELPELQADPDLLAGALENLLKNAFDALPEAGSVIVRTRLEGAPGGEQWTVLSVQDSGVGMDARVRERALDDFFTTKAQGSGLGLSFARRVAEAHGGELLLTSEVGRGTSVELRLPIGQVGGHRPSAGLADGQVGGRRPSAGLADGARVASGIVEKPASRVTQSKRGPAEASG